MQAYTVEQVAEMLHVGRDKVYYLLRTGQLRSIKIGKLRRITDQHLAEFIASLEDEDHAHECIALHCSVVHTAREGTVRPAQDGAHATDPELQPAPRRRPPKQARRDRTAKGP